jgi:phytoene dehydrogenase-like protein
MKVAIIGGGIAGLCTGIYARLNGYNAHIYEMHSKPGGLCTAWQRNGYTIDACVHWFTGSRPGTSLYKLWDEVGVVRQLDFIDLEEASRMEFPDAPPLIFYSDIDRLLPHLTERAPEDKKLLKDFLGDAKRLGEGRELPSDMPPREIQNPLKTLRLLPALLPYMRPVRKWNALTIREFVTRFKNPHLRTAFESIWIPEMSAFTLLMTLAWFHSRQAGYPLGGSMPIAEAAERRFTELGGAIDYRARVAEILVENDSAVGVRLVDGREERCNVVVSAADGHATIFDMLKGRYVDDNVRKWFTEYLPFPPLVFVGIGVNRSFPDEPRLANGTSLGLSEPITIGNRSLDRLSYRLHNFDPSLAPPGKTVITCEIVSDYDYWKELGTDRQRYEAEKKNIGDVLVGALDRRFPGLREQVEIVDVATPLTWERYTGNWRASFEGWLPTPSNMLTVMPRRLPGLDDFYMAGQWVAPGGGLPSGLMTGRQVVQLICHKDGKRFTTTAPAAAAPAGR